MSVYLDPTRTNLNLVLRTFPDPATGDRVAVPGGAVGVVQGVAVLLDGVTETETCVTVLVGNSRKVYAVHEVTVLR